MRSPTSIRHRVLLSMAGVLLVVVAAAAAIAWAVGVHAAADAYDRSLLDPALALAGSVRGEGAERRLDLSEDARRALLFDDSDTIVFQIRDADGRLLAGEADLRAPPTPAKGGAAFHDIAWRGEPMRVASYRAASGITVLVGETLDKRRRLVHEVLLATLVPALLVATAALVLVWGAVGRALAPLDRVRDQLLERTAEDLKPLEAGGAPDEVQPAVVALNRLIDRLRHAVESQQRFVADAAHQLRTPLAGLQMQLELLKRRPHAPEIRAELEKMHAATTRTTRLAHQLLALARAERDTEAAGPMKPFDLYRLGDAAARDWTARAIERDVDLGFEIEHANVLGNEVMLRELLGNLIDNAIRYAPAGSVVTVRCGKRGGRPFLAVEDDGPGIPENARAKVFERFYRVEGTPGDGSGLGLAIVREVANRHGATVELGRPASGRGTAVSVVFGSSAGTPAAPA